MYPYRIRVTDPVLINIFKQVSSIRYYDKIDPNKARIIGKKIPPRIKKDGVIIHDGVFAICNPRIKLDYKPAFSKRRGFDFEFKSLF